MRVVTIVETDGPMAAGDALGDVADFELVAAVAVGLLASCIEVIAHYRGETVEQVRHQIALAGQTAEPELS
jgi:predicted regulator of Ras-like GTPase activity (Roadblock/LC7/MglB family)